MVLERCPCCAPQVSWKLHWQCMCCGSLSSCSIRVHTAIRNERRQLCEHRCLRNKRPHHDHLPSLIISQPQLMRLRRSGITLILSINNLQRCRRYRKSHITRTSFPQYGFPASTRSTKDVFLNPCLHVNQRYFVASNRKSQIGETKESLNGAQTCIENHLLGPQAEKLPTI